MKKLLLFISMIMIISLPFSSFAYIYYPCGYKYTDVDVTNIDSENVSEKLVTNSIAAWNNSGVPIKIFQDNNSLNTIASNKLKDSIVGVYKPFGKYKADTDYIEKLPDGTQGRTTKFAINLNEIKMSDKSLDFKQSVLVHELGHALCLDDDPYESDKTIGANDSIMNYERDRTIVLVPKQDDVKGVTYAYTGDKAPGPNNINKLQPKADYYNYGSREELVSDSNYVIEGKITKDRVTSIDIGIEKPLSLDYMVYKFEIAEVICGDKTLSGEILVKQLISDANLENGDQVILFLESYNDGTPFSIVNPYQGSVEIYGDRVNLNKNNTSILYKKNQAERCDEEDSDNPTMDITFFKDSIKNIKTKTN
jgi:predicted Zn-dependent protease with MMP-like domain